MTPARLEELIARLPNAKHVLECYAQFIREFVSHTDLDKHPYIPDIEEAAENIDDTLAALRRLQELERDVARLADRPYTQSELKMFLVVMRDGFTIGPAPC